MTVLVLFVLVLAMVGCLAQKNNLSEQLKQLIHDTEALVSTNKHNFHHLEEVTTPDGCQNQIDIATASANDMPQAICVEMTKAAGKGSRELEPIPNLSFAWYLQEPNPNWIYDSSVRNQNPFVRPEFVDMKQFYVNLLESLNSEAGGMCPMSTQTRGGSTFLISHDKTLVLKSMVANEAQNWLEHDLKELELGSYPEAILPAIMFFTYNHVSYFIMPGAARMGSLFQVTGMKLLDIKGLIAREGTDEYNLIQTFPRGLGISYPFWRQASVRIARALDFLVLSNRMDYSMLMTAIMTPQSSMPENTLTALLRQINKGAFFAVDLSAMAAFRFRDRHSVATTMTYTFHMQGFADHLETFSNKTMSGVSAILINGVRANTYIASNPIQEPHAYACRMFVFLMTMLFVPVDAYYVELTTHWPIRFQRQFDACMSHSLVDNFQTSLELMVDKAIAEAAAVRTER